MQYLVLENGSSSIGFLAELEPDLYSGSQGPFGFYPSRFKCDLVRGFTMKSDQEILRDSEKIDS